MFYGKAFVYSKAKFCLRFLNKRLFPFYSESKNQKDACILKKNCYENKKHEILLVFSSVITRVR